MAADLTVAALTASPSTPSARFRVAQFIAPLADLGVRLRWLPAPVSKHPPRLKVARPFWLPAAVAARLPGVLASRSADVTLLSRELVSTLYTLEGWTGRPRVLDVDDAVWLHRGGGGIRRLARNVDLVVAGNAFLAEWFGRHCPRVEILPTAVDSERFRPGPPREGPGRIVGWSGTSPNFVYLERIEPALAGLMALRPDVRLRVSSDRRPRLPALPADRVEFVPWTPQGEAAFIQGLDVGLMPLADDDWCRGKCAFKMLLYLACGVPVVVSPVGMNAELLAQAAVGAGARTQEQWVEALAHLLGDDEGRREAGRQGRRLVEEGYSVARIAPRLAGLLRGAADAQEAP